VAWFFEADPSTQPRPRRNRHLHVVPPRRAPNRWLVPGLVCGLVFPATTLLFAGLFAFVPGFRFPFFQGAIGLITVAPTLVALLTSALGFAQERRLAAVAERRPLYRFAVVALALACLDLFATVILVVWGIVTTTVATGGSPF
jgi:hypothetical protein